MSTLAERQLAAWQAIADGWELWGDDRCMRCVACGKSVRVLYDHSGKWYHYTLEQQIALTVLHLRNFHPDLDPDR